MFSVQRRTARVTLTHFAFSSLIAACSTPGGTNTSAGAPDTTVEPAEAGDAGDAESAKAETGAEAEPAATAASEPEPAEPTYTPREGDVLEPHHAIENVDRLASFYDALTRIDDGEKDLVRVVHMGASMIGADDLPAVLRERFQTRFGDGGAGLVLMQRYMANYLHRWVKLEASNWEHCYIAYLCMKDGHYGIGGTTFWSAGGAETTISTRKKELGDEVSRFELWYLARPGGGRLKVTVDREDPITIDTRAEQLEDRYQEFDVEQGPHKINVRATGHGRARTYGVLLETDGPGIVWDQFSKLGIFAKRVMAWDRDHLAGQIKHRDPDLIVFTYGGNDTRRVANGKLSKEQYVEEFSGVIQHIRAGKPEASCLVTGMTDRGRSLNFEITPKHVETIVAAQREAAEKTGCAFFDTYTAMGGGGSLKDWKRRDPPLAAKDLKHLNHRGRVVLGGWIYDAVVSGYVAHRSGAAPTTDG